ncbi:GNAT family N-acetyltransferase [Jeotgalibacillus campisalis]|uniref:N-acetyltransferase domain-containing protein n=1 Tax=Jeotgalibacillus campisalis TaxID=220754 RepID=A0A0C2W544_9BACL|nr:GNAT family N-acetyltransferase [Jeotgalibacillus campisalis]KIL51138.1 hypothetical protein KR50_10190 [Jeotgalibacillus campisalis]
MTAGKEKIIIRTGTLEDAQPSFVLQRAVVSEMDYLVTVPQELSADPDRHIQWIQKIMNHDRETFIVAEVNGELAGWIIFQSPDRKRLAHTGSLGMMVDPAHRGKGIGRLLINDLLKWAESNDEIMKVSLSVFSDNHRAISLYKSAGFKEEGRKVNEIQRNENEYIDDVLLYKMVW